MVMKVLIHDILITLILILVMLYTKRYFDYYRCEKKGFKWNVKTTKLRKKKEEKIRVIVCLENDTVMFDEFDREKGEFSIPGVKAWRYAPPPYRSSKELFKLFKRGNKGEEK